MKLPAGTYYIGDPCYMFHHIDEGIDGVTWNDVCNMFPEWDMRIEAELVTGFGKCFINSTMYGDGEYPVFKDRKFIGSVGVDAGLIGIFPEALVNRSKEVYPDGMQEELYVKVEIDYDFNASYSNGEFIFGPVSVLTGD